MENLKYIEVWLRAVESVWVSPRKIWMILEIAAQLSANDDVGIKEMMQLKEEADKLFDADGNLKYEKERDVVEPTEPRKTGWDFGANKERPKYGDIYYTPFYESTTPNIHNRPSSVIWDNSFMDEHWFSSGIVFPTQQDCQSYIDYLNSLNDGHS